MSLAAALPIPDSTAAYVRGARRLRAQHRRDPGRLHRSLQAISGSIPVCDAKPGHLNGTIPVRSGRAADFAAMVATELEAGILRYSARQKLLAAAVPMGIEKFEANLLIAAVQHRAPIPTKASAASRIVPRQQFLGTAITIAAVQAAIIGGIWWLFF